MEKQKSGIVRKSAREVNKGVLARNAVVSEMREVDDYSDVKGVPVDMVVPLKALQKAIVKDYYRFMEDTEDLQASLHKHYANGITRKRSIDATPRLGFLSPSRSIFVHFDLVNGRGNERQYVRITVSNFTQRAIWGFIVCSEKDDKFKYGDVLLSSSWVTPARNYNRGNIFEKTYLQEVRWARAI